MDILTQKRQIQLYLIYDLWYKNTALSQTKHNTCTEFN